MCLSFGGFCEKKHMKGIDYIWLNLKIRQRCTSSFNVLYSMEHANLRSGIRLSDKPFVIIFYEPIHLVLKYSKGLRKKHKAQCTYNIATAWLTYASMRVRPKLKLCILLWSPFNWHTDHPLLQIPRRITIACLSDTPTIP